MRKGTIPVERIARSIYFLRGQKVMLDRDLAVLYGVETRVLNQAVKRNATRFPSDFMFGLNSEEIEMVSQTVIPLPDGRSRSQFVILKRGQNIKHRPYAFTEQGVAMLSSVLNSERAAKVNIAIMRAFVTLRKTLEGNREFARKFQELEGRVGKHHEKIGAIIEAIRQLMLPPEKPQREIGFHVRESAPKYRSRKP